MSTEMEQILRSLVLEIEAIIDNRVSSASAAPARAAGIGIDDDARAQIRTFEIIAHKPYLDKSELALYLDCSERSIDEWSSRAIDNNPLPVGYVGSHMRAKREKVDRWVEREAQRRRLKLAS